MPQMDAGRHERHGQFGGGRKPNDTKKTIRRLLDYLTGTNRIKFAVVLICIVLSAITGVIGSLFCRC